MFQLEKAAGALFDRTVTRHLHVPPRVRVVAVGGATLGGSGKTPLAIACAAALGASGARVAFVGHAYRANPRRARWVSPRDALEDVGDEALLAARSLESCGVPVMVAPSRAEAIARAGTWADILVLDGVAQLRPMPATLALLSVDPVAPWGQRRALPPRGLLRAPVTTLIAACDAIVPTGDAGPVDEVEGLGRSVWPSDVESRGAWIDGETLLTWDTVRRLAVGLLTALARPERVIASLERRGIFPRAVVSGRDHGPFARGATRLAGQLAKSRTIDLWLATPKCALHAARALPTLPVAVFDHSVTLHQTLRTCLRGMVDRMPCKEAPAAP